MHMLLLVSTSVHDHLLTITSFIFCCVVAFFQVHLPLDSHPCSACPIVTITCASNLVPSWVGQMPQLRALGLVGRFAARSLNKTFSSLSQLDILVIDSNGLLTKLPSGVGRLSSLSTLAMMNCQQLKSLPADFALLKGLNMLVVMNLQKLQQLQTTIYDMAALQILCLIDCPSLQSLPAELVRLPMLQDLYISGCPNVAVQSQEVLNALRNRGVQVSTA
jgi:hypothetical protein